MQTYNCVLTTFILSVLTDRQVKSCFDCLTFRISRMSVKKLDYWNQNLQLRYKSAIKWIISWHCCCCCCCVIQGLGEGEGGSLASNKPTLSLRQGGEGCSSVLCFTFFAAAFSFCLVVHSFFVFLLCLVFLYVFLLFCILSVCVLGVTGLQPLSNATPM